MDFWPSGLLVTFACVVVIGCGTTLVASLLGRLSERHYPTPTYQRSPFLDLAFKEAEEAISSDDPEKKMMAYKLLEAAGPVPGSFGDYNSYGPGPCGHMAPYPGCPKCWH